MKYATIRNERGSITVLTIGAVVIGVTFLLEVANIGNIWLKRDAARDAAEMLAPLLLENQLSYRNINGASNTQVLTNTLAAEAALAQGFGASPQITYQFGTTNGTADFVALNKSDPELKDFDTNRNPAIAVQVSVTPSNIGGLFDKTFADVQGNAIAVAKRKPVNMTCFCNAYCSSYTGMAAMMCNMMCMMFSMMQMMIDMMTLNGTAFLAALKCLFESMQLISTSMWDWVFNAASVTITLPPP